MGLSLKNTYPSDDGPCPARPPAELWRHPKLQLLGRRHSSAGGGAGQASLSDEYAFVNDGSIRRKSGAPGRPASLRSPLASSDHNFCGQSSPL